LRSNVHIESAIWVVCTHSTAAPDASISAFWQTPGVETGWQPPRRSDYSGSRNFADASL
jgi:hypothetical protein